MSTGYQITDQSAMYFITPTIVDWVDVFTRPIYRDTVIESLDFCIRKKGLLVYGYVVMTNHLHLIVRSSVGNLSQTIGDFKKFTSRRITDTIMQQPESRREWMMHRFEWNAAQNERSSDLQVWTHENKPEIIFTRDFYDTRLNYIHDNPVRAGWVVRQEDYLYSSANALLNGGPSQLPLADWYS